MKAFVPAVLLCFVNLALAPPSMLSSRSEVRQMKALMLLESAESLLKDSYQHKLSDVDSIDEIELMLDQLDLALYNLNCIRGWWYRLWTSEALKKQIEDKKETLRMGIEARRDMIVARFDELIARSEIRSSA